MDRNDFWRVFRVSKNIGNAYTTTNEEMPNEPYPEEDLRFEKLTTDGNTTEGFLVHMKFLTKKGVDNVDAKVILDFTKTKYTCKFLNSTLDDFNVQFCPNEKKELAIRILTNRTDKSEVTHNWAENVLKPKLLRWSRLPTNDDSSSKKKPQIQSLQLLDPEEYNDLYKGLKVKYAQQTLQLWVEARESTDPLKFIYEDLAIAAYLICLWRRHGQIKAFADLGCGNGLLVYILCAEGYRGYGYDIRARKLWSLYPAILGMDLIEQAVEPQTFKSPAEVNWLIGNHSDELSPWLPVLAATACYEMHYFLLPCCAFEFSGEKYQRRCSNISTYQEFMSYAKLISEKCGFITRQDRLKIPSTKRLALIGTERTHTIIDYQSRIKDVNSFVADEMTKYGRCVNVGTVKLHEKNEIVRNCTQIDKNILLTLTQNIFHMLLEAGEIVDNTNWQTGGRLGLSEIAQRLGREQLQQIKSECGGLKTLLRNKHEIFEFLPLNNEIGIRRPQVRPPKLGKKLLHTKKRDCFFHLYHPNGCTLSSDDCSFLH